MDSKEKRRAAKSARKLAMEIVNGRRLELDSSTFCRCAAHYVAIGAGLQSAAEAGRDYSPAEEIDELTSDAPMGLGLLSVATDVAVGDSDLGHGALVFPLLATADALDAAAEREGSHGRG